MCRDSFSGPVVALMVVVVAAEDPVMGPVPP